MKIISYGLISYNNFKLANLNKKLVHININLTFFRRGGYKYFMSELKYREPSKIQNNKSLIFFINVI